MRTRTKVVTAIVGVPVRLLGASAGLFAAGAGTISENHQESAPIKLNRSIVPAPSREPSLAAQYKWWIDVGDADPWRDAVITFHDALTDLEIPHEWTVYSGDHSAAYWTARASDYLTYYSNALCGATTACR